jgi:hypothetical protein
MQTPDSLSKHFLYYTFIDALLAWVFSLTTTILMAAFGFDGFGSNTPIVATCTTIPYLDSKLSLSSNIGYIIKVSFINSIVANVLATIIVIMLVFWIINICKD